MHAWIIELSQLQKFKNIPIERQLFGKKAYFNVKFLEVSLVIELSVYISPTGDCIVSSIELINYYQRLLENSITRSGSILLIISKLLRSSC